MTPFLPTPSSAPRAAPLRRLDYLDGVRAFAALWVLLGHAVAKVYGSQWHGGLRGLPLVVVTDNHMAVDIFIVLSGFCLILPVAAQGTLSGGTIGFYRRRARRILPPVAAALVLFLVLGSLVAQRLAAYSPRDVLVNALLLQDLFPSHNVIDGPCWSVATEWKIYFLFPLLVWMLFRYGRWAVLMITSLLGYGLMALWWSLPLMHNQTSCPWYVFLFGMGVCSGHAVVRQTSLRWAWGVVCLAPLAFAAVSLGGHVHSLPSQVPFLPVLDPLAGALTAGILALLSGCGNRGILSWRPLVLLGTFSYSVYLLHMPLLSLAHMLFRLRLLHALPEAAKFLLLIGPASLLILAVCFLFYLVFERPFLTSRRKAMLADMARDAALSPAP